MYVMFWILGFRRARKSFQCKNLVSWSIQIVQVSGQTEFSWLMKLSGSLFTLLFPS